MKRKLITGLKKLMQIKLNALVLIFAGTVMLYAATKGADGLWNFGSGDVISASQINENFQSVKTPQGAIMAFYRTSCPAGWVAADGDNGTPDLRGQFIRGLNNFGSAKGTRNDGKQDPDSATREPGALGALGSFQWDEIKSHRHTRPSVDLKVEDASHNYGEQAFRKPEEPHVTTFWTGDTGGNESRSKNIALIFCMKQ